MRIQKNQNIYRISGDSTAELFDALPANTYVLKHNERADEFYLELCESFKMPTKIYGVNNTNAERIVETFLDRPSSTGVLLAGEKGSGKTLLTKQISVRGLSLGIPTIIINSPYGGDTFNKFMQDLDQPVIIIFDEYEKVYSHESQQQLLTLMDGVFSAKKLFLLTTNDKWRIDSHMRNRPGRIYYMLEFSGLNCEFITEYCNDNLKNKEHIKTLCEYSLLFSQFNFDLLKAFVEEMNRYNETPSQVGKILNARPEMQDDDTYIVHLTYEGKELKKYAKEWHGNPLTSHISIWSELSSGYVEIINKVINKKPSKSQRKPEIQICSVVDESDEYNDNGYANFALSDLYNVDKKTGSFVFKKEKWEVHLTKKTFKVLSYDDIRF